MADAAGVCGSELRLRDTHEVLRRRVFRRMGMALVRMLDERHPDSSSAGRRE